VGNMGADNPGVYGLTVVSPDGKSARGLRPEEGSVNYLTAPAHMALSGNGDVCMSTTRDQVVILDWNGNILATYKPRSQLKMITSGIFCGFVADYRNNCVHMLNMKGRFQQILVEESDGLKDSPRALAIDKLGHMWIGETSGNIRM
jgi:hypothetical protein